QAVPQDRPAPGGRPRGHRGAGCERGGESAAAARPGGPPGGDGGRGRGGRGGRHQTGRHQGRITGPPERPGRTRYSVSVQARRMASGSPHQPSGVSRSSSSIAPSTDHIAVTCRNSPSMLSSSKSSSYSSKSPSSMPGPSAPVSSSSSSSSTASPAPATLSPMTSSGSKSLTYRARSAADAGVPGPPVTS